MRQPFLFALIAVILGATLYAVYFIESGTEEIPTLPTATSTTAEGERDRAPLASDESTSHDESPAQPIVRIGGVEVSVTVASTPDARSQGLSGRSGLAQNEGMLFVFPEDGLYSFWMKDMRFSIDILWLSGDGTVVHIEENVDPGSYPATYTSTTPARYVLEVPAGFVKARNIAAGSRAELPR